MSESTPNPAATESPDLSAMLLADLLEDAPAQAPAEAVAEPVVTPPVESAAAPATEEPKAAAAPPADANPGEVVVPTWANQEEAGRSFAEKIREANEAKEAARKAEEARAAKEAEANYWRGLAEGRGPQQPAEAAKPKVDTDPEPDPEKFADEGAYFNELRAWDRRQAAKEIRAEMLPEMQALKEFAANQAWDASMARAQAEAGAEWDAVADYANRMRARSPGFNHDLLSAGDPGAFALESYRLARGLPPSPAAPAAPADTKPVTPAAAPAPAAPDLAALLADPVTRDAALRIIAEHKAAAGVIPTVPPNGPRGAGSGPGAQGAPDEPAAVTVETIKATKNPQQLAEIGRGVFGSFLVGDT